MKLVKFIKRFCVLGAQIVKMADTNTHKSSLYGFLSLPANADVYFRLDCKPVPAKLAVDSEIQLKCRRNKLIIQLHTQCHAPATPI